MKTIFLLFLSTMVLFSCCSKRPDEKPAEKTQEPSTEINPFFSEFDTPFNVPAFDKINEEHHLPAFVEGMKRQKAEIEKIVESSQSPTFENTIEALDRSGSLLKKVNNVFEVLKDSMTNERMQAIAKSRQSAFNP